MQAFSGPMPNVAGNAATYMNQYAARYPQQPKPKINPNLMSQAANNTFRRTGTTVPTELALAQAQFETKFGTKARKDTDPYLNPFNVGVWDNKTVYNPTTQAEGIQRYYDLMADSYLKKKTLTQLLLNFVNTAGNRYASDPDYERKLSEQIPVVRRRMQ